MGLKQIFHIVVRSVVSSGRSVESAMGNMQNTADASKKKMKRRRRCCKNTCILLLGVLLTSLGTLILLYFSGIYEVIINSALVFNPSSRAYKAWRINDPPLIMDIYIFNWTNPEDIYTEGVKPRFEEIGPFKFREIKEKFNITWNDNKTVTYRQRKFFYFMEEESPRQLDEEITTLNPVPLTAAYRARHWGYFSKLFLSSSLSRFSTISVTKPARELLFEGYEDGFLTLAGAVPFVEVKDRFGFFYKKNGTNGTDGVFSMSTANDQNFGKLLEWNYSNRTEFYEGNCAKINGSAGEFYPINRGKDTISVYSAELCKNAVLEYEKEVEIKGVKGYKYSAMSLFDNGTLKPENQCFCGGECLPSGVLNVSSCRENSPSFLSLPHFYDADPYYTDSLEGLHPQKDKHEFYITLEPKSGILIDISVRMQLNMFLQPIRGIDLYENVPKMVFPIFYFTQSIPMTDELASKVKLLQSLPYISRICALAFIGLGSLIMVVLGLYLLLCRHPKYHEEYKVPHSVHEEVPLRSCNGAALAQN